MPEAASTGALVLFLLYLSVGEKDDVAAAEEAVEAVGDAKQLVVFPIPKFVKIKYILEFVL